jgi:hypothetical protein
LPTPNPGNWTINPGAYTGNSSTFTLNSQPAGTYNFTVTDNNSCISAVSPITIIAVPTTPTAPIVGTPSQPSCSIPTGSVVLSGLPTGTWTITKSPGGETYTATGSNYTVTNLTTGTYTFTVSNGTCSSSASSNVVINAAPSVTAPIVGLIEQPTCSVATGSVTLSGLPSGSWTLTRLPDNVNFSSNGLSTTIPGLSTGIYNYRVTDANGCVSSNTTNIPINTQPATPVAPVANAQSFLVSDNATVANLVIVSAGTPNWYSSASGGTAINSATLLTTGIYYASQTINGCESQTRLLIIVQIILSSNEFDKIKIVYYPNPVNNMLYIKAPIEVTNVKIYNLLGQKMLQQKFNSNEIQINMSDFSSGTYFVTVESDDKTKTIKILKD